MEIRTQSHDLDPNRVTVLVLQAGTFEEERILTAIMQAITRGGTIVTNIPVDDDTERVVELAFKSFRIDKRKRRGHDG